MYEYDGPTIDVYHPVTDGFRMTEGMRTTPQARIRDMLHGDVSNIHKGSLVHEVSSHLFFIDTNDALPEKLTPADVVVHPFVRAVAHRGVKKYIADLRRVRSYNFSNINMDIDLDDPDWRQSKYVKRRAENMGTQVLDAAIVRAHGIVEYYGPDDLQHASADLAARVDSIVAQFDDIEESHVLHINATKDLVSEVTYHNDPDEQLQRLIHKENRQENAG